MAAAGGWWHRRWRRLLPALLLVVITFAAYQPVWHARYIWDDDILLTGNEAVKSFAGLRTIWLTTELADYFPVTSSLFLLQWQLWGDTPLGYHLVNVLLHALAAVLWWRILARLKVPGAWLAATIFALHPVNVESVAWISELKNTLAMAFYTLATLAWLKAEETGAASEAQGARFSSTPADPADGGPDMVSAAFGAVTRPLSSALVPPPAWYWLSFAAFVLALLSKTAVAPFPAVLLAFAWWRRGRIAWRDLRRSLPFFAAAGVLALVTIWFQYHRAIGSTVVRDDDFWSRLACAGRAVWFYLGKALLPHDLVIVYPRWAVDGASVWSHLPGLLLVAVAVACWRHRDRWGRGWLFAWGYFVAMLLPILGFFNVGAMRYSLVADRWQYFSIIVPIAVVAAGITAGWRKLGGSAMPAAPWPGRRDWARGAGTGLALYAAATVLLVVLLGTVTWRQCHMYRDLDTLWDVTLTRNPDCAIAHNDVGNRLYNEGRLDEAIAHFEKALAVLPEYEMAQYNYACALLDRSDIPGAIDRFERAVRIEPNFGKARYNLGTTLLKQGRLEEAIVHLRSAVTILPKDARAHNNLASAYLQNNQYRAAVRHYEIALDIDPNRASAWNNLGRALLQLGCVDEAITPLRRAEELLPDDPLVRSNLGEALERAGRLPEAIVQYEKLLVLQPGTAGDEIDLGRLLVENGRAADAIPHLLNALELSPGDADAYDNLGGALLQTGQVAEAVVQYRKAIEAQPAHAAAHNHLGFVLARTGAVDEAIAEFEQAVAMQPDYADAHRNLGDTLAGRGRLDDAAGHLARAVELQPNDGAAHSSLGGVCRRQGRLPDAIAHYEAALQLEPENPDFLCALAWLLATAPDARVRNGDRAVELARRANRNVGGQNPAVLRVLAAGCAEQGRMADAVTWSEQALRLFDMRPVPALREVLAAELAGYRAGTPVREDLAARSVRTK